MMIRVDAVIDGRHLNVSGNGPRIELWEGLGMKALGMKLGVCIKDTEKRVLTQNRECKAICGNREGSICNEGCMRQYRARQNEGVELQNALPLFDKDVCDAVILNDGDHITTLLVPLMRKSTGLMEKLEAKGLTSRESEILGLALDRLTNAQIADRLSISRATVKTHLNNIYKKIPKDWIRNLA